MAKDRIVFVPWNDTQSGKFGTDGDWSNRQKANTHHKRTWTTYYLNSPGKPLAELGMGTGARLHIFAHGNPPGQDNTKAFPDVQGASPVSIASLADMLVDKGLPKKYLGTVVCDVCYSALGTPSFAKQLARALNSRGYVCAVMGHQGAIYPVYYRYGEFKDNTYEHRMVAKLDGTKVKSKHAQERFWGFN